MMSHGAKVHIHQVHLPGTYQNFRYSPYLEYYFNRNYFPIEVTVEVTAGFHRQRL